MRSSYILSSCLLLAVAGTTGQCRASRSHANQSAAELEARLRTIDAELDQLASYSLRAGFGAIGHASYPSDSPHASEWVQVDWARATPIEEIVLVPTIGRDSEDGLRANAFPVRFNVLAGIKPDTRGAVIASYDESDQLLPRIAPLIIPCATTASWIRVEASMLSRRIFDNKYDLKLAEIMAFNGQDNVALRARVTTSSVIWNRYLTQKPRFLTDGFVPYLMDAARGEPRRYFLSMAIPEEAWLSIDLGAPYPLDQINLHAVDQSFSVPLEYETDFYIPRSLRIEGALEADFSDAKTLIELTYDSLLDLGPIMMHPFPETECRYVRLTNFEPYVDAQFAQKKRIGFAEIELFSHGVNVARNRPIQANFAARGAFGISALTNGHNFYGKILSIRDWMNQLARRHLLEKERPRIATKLGQLYARQEKKLKWTRRLALIAVAGIGLSILVNRMIRMRTVITLRERIAANLHDELSANLHALALLGEMAHNNIGEREKLNDILPRVQHLSNRSRNAARHCTNMLRADIACEDLVEEMTRSANRLLIDTRHDMQVEGEAFLARLAPRKRMDLFLFYKECLINIARHADATECVTRLACGAKVVHMEVTDNGTGVVEPPLSLKRRARLLGARLTVKTPSGGGTTILLSLRLRRWSSRGPAPKRSNKESP